MAFTEASFSLFVNISVEENGRASEMPSGDGSRVSTLLLSLMQVVSRLPLLFEVSHRLKALCIADVSASS